MTAIDSDMPMENTENGALQTGHRDGTGEYTGKERLKQ